MEQMLFMETQYQKEPPMESGWEWIDQLDEEAYITKDDKLKMCD